jgi:arginyl-tRNA synthetase
LTKPTSGSHPSSVRKSQGAREGPATPGPAVERPLHQEVRERVEAAWRQATEQDLVPPLPEGAELPVVEIARPTRPEHGDYASNLALKLARPLRRNPIEIGEAIATALRPRAGPIPESPIAEVSVAAPGFINLRISSQHLERVVDAARAAGPSFGRLRAERPARINVEFVSANPTGPLHIGNARGAFVGDLLSRLLEAAGHGVTREYYFNDVSTQVRNLGASVLALRAAEPVPQDGYRGGYVSELANDVPEEILAATAAEPDPAWAVGRWASERIRSGIEASLARLGVRFDVWKTEGSLHSEGWVERGVEMLRESGHLYESEGALWFRSTDFGDDKDRVVIRSNGQPTYFAADIGYLAEKFSRGFDHLVYVWGADHHGTVARLVNAAQALGHPREAVEVVLIAWVRFVREGEEISMSKRSGEFITLDELLEEVGVDAARWFFAARSHTSGIDFDIDAAKDETAANPVHYVRYAHARIASILRKAAETGIAPAGSLAGTLASDPVAQGLAKEILRLPEVVEEAAAARELQAVTAYATQLATTFHAYYRDRRVVDPADPQTSAQRLALVDAARLALANVLGLLGVSAPEQM